MNTYMAKGRGRAAQVVRRGRGRRCAGPSGQPGRQRSCAARTSLSIRPHVDTGDYVIVINADKVVLTGKKLDQKVYYHAQRLYRAA